MVEYGWDQTPTPDLGLDITKAPEDIQKLYKWVIQKRYGEDVASAYAQAMVLVSIIAKNAEAMSLFTSGQMDTLDQFVKDTLIELTEKDIISAPEIIASRDGYPTLDSRLEHISKSYDSVSEMCLDVGLKVGDRVSTFGFYNNGDGGGAEYRILASGTVNDMNVFETAGGLRAVLVMGEEVNVAQLGAKGNYNPEASVDASQDDTDIINFALRSTRRVVLGHRKKYNIAGELEIRQPWSDNSNNAPSLIGNGSTLYDTTGTGVMHVKIKTFWSKPKLSDLVVQGKDRLGTGIRVASENGWGGTADFDRVLVQGFNIGVYVGDAFNCVVNTLKVSDNNVGLGIWQLELHPSFTNLCTFNGFEAIDNKIGLYSEYLWNTNFNSATIQGNEYGAVISDTNYNNEFLGTWFERNTVENVAYGLVDDVTTEITLSDIFNQRAGIGVRFKNNRVGEFHLPEFASNLKDSRFKFEASYEQSVNTTPQKTVDGLFMAGVQYQNILVNSRRFEVRKNNVIQPSMGQVEQSPIGGHYFVTIPSQLDANWEIYYRLDAGDFYQQSSVYYFSFMVKATQNTYIQVHYVNNNQGVISNYTTEQTYKDGWQEVSVILKVYPWVDGASIRIRVPDFNKTSSETIKIGRPMLINLTNIFGAGEEPTPNMANRISKYLSYVGTRQQAVTGSLSKIINQGSTNARPKGAMSGDMYFDTTINKPVWCKQQATYNLETLEFANSPVWVDATGTVV